MSNETKMIAEISALNNRYHACDSDMLTIDKHGNSFYIYSRFYLWRGTIFSLNEIATILLKYGYSFYLSSTRYDFPVIVVQA